MRNKNTFCLTKGLHCRNIELRYTWQRKLDTYRKIEQYYSTEVILTGVL